MQCVITGKQQNQVTNCDGTNKRAKIYDERDDFYFEIVKFPFLDEDIPQFPSYGVWHDFTAHLFCDSMF